MGFLRTIKICSTLSFGGEVKPEVPCKEFYEYEKKYFVDKILHFHPPDLPDLLLDNYTVRIAGEHSVSGGWIRSFLQTTSHTMVLYALVSPED
jgi:hypothetical protein